MEAILFNCNDNGSIAKQQSGERNSAVKLSGQDENVDWSQDNRVGTAEEMLDQIRDKFQVSRLVQQLKIQAGF